MGRRKSGTGLGRAGLRGGVSASHLLTVSLLALAGAAGVAALGASMDTAIGGTSSGGIAASMQAGEAEAPAPPPAPNSGAGGPLGTTPVAVAAGATGSGDATNTESDWERAVRESEDCGWNVSCRFREAGEFLSDVPVLGPVHNFVTNFGLNPGAWIADPLGQLEGMWHRVYGVGQFAWNTVYGLGTLLHNGNSLFNPVYPGFWYSVAQNGPGGHAERVLGVMDTAWDTAWGVGEYGWRANNLRVGYECLTGGAAHCSEYIRSVTDEGWNNVVVQALVEPFRECGGEVGSNASENACGQVAGDLALAILTGGAGKGATGAGRAGSFADDFADAGRIASHADELADAGRAGRAANSDALWDDFAGHARPRPQEFVDSAPDAPGVTIQYRGAGVADAEIGALPRAHSVGPNLNTGSGTFNDVYTAVGPDGQAIVVKSRKPEVWYDLNGNASTPGHVVYSSDAQLTLTHLEANRAYALQRYGGPQYYGEVSYVDEAGRVRPGVAMERVDGVDMLTMLRGPSDFPITSAHRASLDRMFAQMRADGVTFGDFHAGQLILTRDGRVVPIDMDVVPVGQTTGVITRDTSDLARQLDSLIARDGG